VLISVLRSVARKLRIPVHVVTHCFLYREALLSKSVLPEDRKVLEMIRTVNYLKVKGKAVPVLN
jgi:hypothetical protein